MTSVLPARHIDLIKHALGWPKMYRNHFVAEFDTPDYFDWIELTERGLATRMHVTEIPYGDVFHVTDAGRAMLAASETNNG